MKNSSYNELIESIDNNDESKFKSCLNPDIINDVIDNDGNSILHLIGMDGNTKFLEILEDYAPKLNLKNNQEYTPLELSIFNGQSEFAKRLIESGADVNTSHEGYSLIHACSACNLPELLDQLLSKGLGVDDFDENGSGRTPLMWAVQEGNIDIVKILISKGANINARNESETPLHLASSEGHLNIVKLLIENGVDISVRINGTSPLHNASAWNHLDTVKYLISIGLSPDESDSDGNTALSFAKMYSHNGLEAYLSNIN